MVGHPNETENDFNELINFVRELKFERLGAFAYSHEEGTFAYQNYSDNIPFDIKEERLNKLMEKLEFTNGPL